MKLQELHHGDTEFTEFTERSFFSVNSWCNEWNLGGDQILNAPELGKAIPSLSFLRNKARKAVGNSRHARISRMTLP